MSARSALVAAVCLLTAVGCRGTQSPAADPAVLNPPPSLGLRPVALPDFSKMEASAQAQMRAQASAVRTKMGASRTELGAAYGEIGKLLMAATYLEAAESALLNAQTLAPDDYRWPYYLGQIYKVKGPVDKSVASFERALQLKPADEATLVWLGEAYLAQGRADAATPLFSKALSIDPKSAAARLGSGRAALAARNYPAAVKDLEEALAIDPRATAIHYPLAMAYRGLGNVAKAEAHLKEQGDLEAQPVDPLMRELDGLLQTGEAYNVRGGAELEAGNWAAAADQFRKGLELSPNDASLRHRLGTALYQMGNSAAAAEQFEQVLGTSPRHARAHFSLGVLMAESGRYDEAIAHFRSTIEFEPGYIPARVQLANALARSGRAQDAIGEYGKALEADHTLVDAEFGYAMALVRLRRYAEARDRLTEATKLHPSEPVFVNALARLLAAAPDDRVRDGGQAKALVDQLMKGPPTLELAETAAMMLAELGDYRQAAAAQRDALTAAEQQGLRDVAERLAENLRRYERGEPCRRPFADTEFP